MTAAPPLLPTTLVTASNMGATHPSKTWAVTLTRESKTYVTRLILPLLSTDRGTGPDSFLAWKRITTRSLTMATFRITWMTTIIPIDRAAPPETAGIAFLLLKKCQRQLRCQAQGGPRPQSSLTTVSVTWANSATASTHPLPVCPHWILAHPVF